jgi:ferrous iron transport protein B
MVDVAEEKGLTINLERLRQQLRVPIVPIQANRGKGIDELRAALAKAEQNQAEPTRSPLPDVFQQETAAVVKMTADNAQPLPSFLAARLLLDTSGYLAGLKLPGVTPAVWEQIETARRRLKDAGATVPGIEAVARYQWAAKVLAGVVERPRERRELFSDRVDRWLTHWFSGTLIFICVMLLVFQGVAWIAGPASGLVELMAGGAKSLVQWLTPDGPLRSLLERGIIDGVGGVLVSCPKSQPCFCSSRCSKTADICRGLLT